MRQIGHLETESAARDFGDFLYVQGIHNQIDHEPNDGWAVWVLDEEQLPRAKQFLAEFRVDPNDAKFSSHREEASRRRREEEKTQTAYAKKIKSRGQLFRQTGAGGFGPVTLTLIVISVVVFVLMKFGHDSERVMKLFITDYWRSGSFLEWRKGLPEVMRGEVWRLLTPIFLHFNLLHIVFNMFALRDLGSMIEARQNSWVLASLVLMFGVGSNFAEFYFERPDFGGMSGVLFGLFGYIWMRGKFDPGSGLYLHPTNVWMMILWFVLCWAQVIPGIANIAHTAGLVMGMAVGWATALRYR
jgi:GlpG protein